MGTLLTRPRLSPFLVGACIGMLSWITFGLMGKARGTSTTFVTVVASLQSFVVPEHVKATPYLAKHTKIDWQFMLVIGLAIISGLLFWWLRGKDVPGLAEMAQAALNVLDDDPDGFFLMIEGGAVDWASHSNQTGRMIEEEMEFNKAVRAVLEWVGKRSNWRQTLFVVTGDHECGYLTGPGSGASDQGPKWNPPVGHGHGQVPDVEWHSKKHTNSLIPFYAQGRDAERFSRAAKNRDPVRGRYIDNTDVGKILQTVLTSRW